MTSSALTKRCGPWTGAKAGLQGRRLRRSGESMSVSSYRVELGPVAEEDAERPFRSFLG
jgi:hypothetical protein